MKIAHFADLHINSCVRESNISETMALFEHAMKNETDHFFITGDVSHNSDPEDFEALRRILEYFGILDSDKVSIVIGNHDIFGGPQKAEDIFTFPQRCRDEDYDNKVLEFNGYFTELFESAIFLSPNNKYPYAKIINGILILGINSIDRYSSMKNPFASNGAVDEEQLNETEKILAEFSEQAKRKIVLIHHHFNKIKAPSNNMMHYFWQVVEKQTMKLRNKKNILELFNKYEIDAVFHGHIHENDEYLRKGIRFINGGGCFNNIKDGEISYNQVDITRKHIKTQIVTFPYSKRKNKRLFEPLSLQTIS